MEVRHFDIAPERIHDWLRRSDTFGAALCLLWRANREILERDTYGTHFLRVLAFISEATGDVSYNRDYFTYRFFHALPETAQKSLNALSFRIREDWQRIGRKGLGITIPRFHDSSDASTEVRAAIEEWESKRTSSR